MAAVVLPGGHRAMSGDTSDHHWQVLLALSVCIEAQGSSDALGRAPLTNYLAQGVQTVRFSIWEASHHLGCSQIPIRAVLCTRPPSAPRPLQSGTHAAARRAHGRGPYLHGYARKAGGSLTPHSGSDSWARSASREEC